MTYSHGVKIMASATCSLIAATVCYWTNITRSKIEMIATIYLYINDTNQDDWKIIHFIQNRARTINVQFRINANDINGKQHKYETIRHESGITNKEK